MSISVTTSQEHHAPPTTPVVDEKGTPSDSAPTATADVQKEDTATSEAAETEDLKDDSNESESEDAGENSADANEDSEDSEEAEQEPVKKKTKGGFQRRIDKLNSRISAKDQEIDYWKSQALKQTPAEQKPEIETNPVQTEKPKADDFENHSDYIEALTDWKTEQALNKRDQKLLNDRLKSEQEAVKATYNEKVAEFKKTAKDFDQALKKVADIPISPAFQALVMNSPNGPALAYELAKNRDEFLRISKLSPLECGVEMGKLEARLENKPSADTEGKKTITKVPKPIHPVGGGKGVVPKSIYDSTISQTEYEKLRAEQRAARAKAM